MAYLCNRKWRTVKANCLTRIKFRGEFNVSRYEIWRVNKKNIYVINIVAIRGC
jgi:hypothetical protein